MLKRIAHSPYLNLFCGIVLLITAGVETWRSLIELPINEISLASHHGILVFSLVQILKALPEILEGVKEIEKSLPAQ